MKGNRLPIQGKHHTESSQQDSHEKRDPSTPHTLTFDPVERESSRRLQSADAGTKDPESAEDGEHNCGNDPCTNIHKNRLKDYSMMKFISNQSKAVYGFGGP